MKVTINTQQLTRALRATERVVGKNVTLPILSTVRFETQQGYVQICATNLELGIRYRIGAKIDTPGDIALPARVFTNLVSNIQDEKISISTQRETAHVVSQSNKTTVLGMKTDEFPIIPTVKPTHEIKIQATYLVSALGRVVDAASLSESRPELSGVLVDVNKSTLTCVATDSFRLAEAVVDAQNNESRSYIIPKNTVLEILRLLDGEEMVTLNFSDSQIMVQNNDFELVSRLVDGRYPEYKKVIPDGVISQTIVFKEDLERAVRMASVFSSSILDVRLSAQKDTLRIEAKNADRGEARTSIPAELKSKPFDISVNYQYILDGMKHMRADRVHLQFTGESSPLIIRPAGDTGYTYVIMPLRS